MAKSGIHPEYQETKVTCSCGNTFTVMSNRAEISAESCNQCHPAYTGKQGVVSKTGAVDKFNRRYGLTEDK